MARVSDPVHGVLLLDKPLGVSSNHALQRARFALGAAKAGHTGSLDPLATGMLPLCFGEATKIAGLLLGSHKRYLAQIVLGSTTTTDDAEGTIISTTAVTTEMRELAPVALASFVGRIRQRPPIYSALKQQGVPLYKRARRGEEVATPERDADVFAIDFQGVEGDRLQVEIECGSGTYIRSIARDLGERLGCGAYLGALRRLWVDPFQSQRMVSLEEILDAGTGMRSQMLPTLAALARFASVVLDAEQVTSFRQGRPVRVTDCEDAQPLVVKGPLEQLIGLGRFGEDRWLWPQRVFNGL